MGTFQCKTCGKISKDKSKLCDSSSTVSALYVCGDCNKQSGSAEDICKPKEVTPSFYCKKCGSSSTEKKGLCKPMQV